MTGRRRGRTLTAMPDFEVERRTRIAADPARVRDLIDDLRAWQAWSPWEGLDADLRRTYSGPARGVGSTYAWSGNRKAGQGSIEILASGPEEVVMALRFLKPFKADNRVVFHLEPTGPGGAETDVAWRMTGRSTGLPGLIGRLVPMDRLVGKDFERGLAQLKDAAEA
ncbi:SRPBCC family protein [Nocardioides fonticola]|uniref:SRPBCC family protein n=2 Tax=Nocardioides fonticola TaxID=450363 RepID=A0ABP7XC63_9ACTN